MSMWNNAVSYRLLGFRVGGFILHISFIWDIIGFHILMLQPFSRFYFHLEIPFYHQREFHSIWAPPSLTWLIIWGWVVHKSCYHLYKFANPQFPNLMDSNITQNELKMVRLLSVFSLEGLFSCQFYLQIIFKHIYHLGKILWMKFPFI